MMRVLSLSCKSELALLVLKIPLVLAERKLFGYLAALSWCDNFSILFSYLKAAVTVVAPVRNHSCQDNTNALIKVLPNIAYPLLQCVLVLLELELYHES